MRISDKTMEKLLESSGSVTAEQAHALKEEAIRSKRSVQEVILQNDIISDTDLTRLYAKYAQIPFIELTASDVAPDALQRIPEKVARQYNAILFKADETGYHLAMEDPDDVQAENFLEKELGDDVKIYITTHESIMAALEAYHSNVDDELKEVIDIQRADDTENEAVVNAKEISEDSPIAKTISLLLEYAIKSKASDVHIEPREAFIQVRYRIDGVLREVNRLPVNVLGALVSRIKILANLKIDEHRVPQDGRFKVRVGGKQYALRVSTLPVSDGEKVVMRILDESNQAVTLEELGYWGKSLSTIRPALKEADGMILITGPTGSGKSTSLFSILTILNTPEVNISTVEDPVEYKIPGVNQTQTNSKAGMTFANGLRALLRQDPNIIMIGEIRDQETADLGVQAALTGHLVFSTLHTNDAATCLPRLLDMGIEPFLIASIIRVVVGQRLVRRVRTETRIQYVPSDAEKQLIIKMFNLKPGQDFRHIHELEKQAAAEGVGGDTPLSTDENGINFLWKNNPEDNNDGSLNGYRGRIGIYEVLNNSVAMQQLIVSNATSNQLKERAVAEGMTTMQTDGLVKVLRGVTTLDEVIRVTKDQ